MVQDGVVILSILKKDLKRFVVPSVTQIASRKSPFQVLISCILSLRTKDKTTIEASKRLFAQAVEPKTLIKLSKKKIESLIYPVGFYRNKARDILNISNLIVRDFGGRVPNSLEQLLNFKGVGRKTANLVLGLGFGIPAICVDTHVHRISNRLGWVKTKDPNETEIALSRIIPKKYWVELNTVLVTFGQNICLPISPWCSKCPVEKSCKRAGVYKYR
jgi:endonuclease-3